MRRSSNVLPFPSGMGNGLYLKLFVMLFHLGLAAMLVAVLPLSEGALSVVLLTALVYYIFLRRRLHQSGALRRNAWLLILLTLLLTFLYPAPVIFVGAMSLLYWLLVGRAHREAPFFVRFHLLSALTAHGLLLFPFLIAAAVLSLGAAMSRLAHLEPVVSPAIQMMQTGLWGLYLLAFGGLGIYLGVNALLGKTPYLWLVSGNVRHWT